MASTRFILTLCLLQVAVAHGADRDITPCDIRLETSDQDYLFIHSTTKAQQQLFRAIERNDEERVRSLLAKGTDPNFRDTGYDWVINDAIGMWNPFIVKDLLEKGADPNRLDCLGMPPLWYLAGLASASRVGDESLVQIADELTTFGARLKGKKNEYWSAPLFVSAAEGGRLRLLAWLLDHGIAIDAPGAGETALMAAIRANQVAAVEYLLVHGASTAAPLSQQTPLLMAVKSGNVELVKMLLEHGADPNEGRIVGTPLGDALGKQFQASLHPSPKKAQYDEIVQLLRHAGAIGNGN
jgi:hypothetical protein